MALRRLLLPTTKQPSGGAITKLAPPPPASAVVLETTPQNVSNTNTNFHHREYLISSSSSSPDQSTEKGFFRRFLHRNAIATQLPEFLSIPVGEKLREKLIGINNNSSADRIRLHGLMAPPAAEKKEVAGVSVEEARKLLRVTLAEKIKRRLQEIPTTSISYTEFVNVCVKECGNNEDQGTEFAQALDLSGNVIVLGNLVFLRPQQVAQSVQAMIAQSMGVPNDPRRKQLAQLEIQKAQIDEKAKKLVQGELYCGLGFLVVQTLGFMRLTFWELTWDVMEPICFFVTSLNFAFGYAFFLRTSTEPSFEGYFRRRFKAKQKKLMQIQNFDVDKYNELRRMFYCGGDLPQYKPLCLEEEQDIVS